MQGCLVITNEGVKSMNRKGQMNVIIPLIGMVIFIIIAMALAPLVADTANGGLANGTAAGLGQNLTAAGRGLLPIIPLTYIVIIIVAILGFMSAKND